MTRNMTRKSESPDKIGAFYELATGIGQSVKCSFYAWLCGFYNIYYKYSYFKRCINSDFAVIGFKSMTRKYDTKKSGPTRSRLNLNQMHLLDNICCFWHPAARNISLSWCLHGRIRLYSYKSQRPGGRSLRILQAPCLILR